MIDSFCEKKTPRPAATTATPSSFFSRESAKHVKGGEGAGVVCSRRGAKVAPEEPPWCMLPEGGCLGPQPRAGPLGV